MSASLAEITPTPGAGAMTAAPGHQPMSERELAEVIGAFNDVTTKLHGAHETLRAEVGRLKNELRLANEQLERSRRLAALGEMAAGIAHEVRNPLGSIRLYARMLEQDLHDRPSERLVAEKIGSAVRGLDAVVMDVLAFAKEMRVRPESLDVDAIIERAVGECLAGDGANLDREPGTSSPIRIVRLGQEQDDRAEKPELVCDGHLTHRALVNVVRNAIQAMRADPACDKPTLTITFAERQLAGHDGDQSTFALIAVQDNGPGIPPDVMERIFNPFFTTRATGTGLGLSIVHRIMDAHGGRVVVRNAGESSAHTERGTLVELLFPVHGKTAVWSMDTPACVRGEGSPALAGS